MASNDISGDGDRTGARVRVKVCGVTTVEDALLAARLGADAVGLNFYPYSPRYITPDTARAILAALPPFVEPVALFVDEAPADVRDALARLPGVCTVQLHGTARRPVPWAPYRAIPAFPVRDPADLDALLAHVAAAPEPPAAVLVDAHVPGLHGGTGRTAPWHLLADFIPPRPLILAGGLTPDNVAAAIRAVRPAAVDVASGVESAPGRKDPAKLADFLAAARAAEH